MCVRVESYVSCRESKGETEIQCLSVLFGCASSIFAFSSSLFLLLLLLIPSVLAVLHFTLFPIFFLSIFLFFHFMGVCLWSLCFILSFISSLVVFFSRCVGKNHLCCVSTSYSANETKRREHINEKRGEIEIINADD